MSRPVSSSELRHCSAERADSREQRESRNLITTRQQEVVCSGGGAGREAQEVRSVEVRTLRHAEQTESTHVLLYTVCVWAQIGAACVYTVSCVVLCAICGQCFAL